MTIQLTITAQTPEQALEILTRLSPTSVAPQISGPAIVDAPPVAESTPSSPSPVTVGDSPETGNGSLLVSAPVKAYAEENGIDLHALTGSGKNGRITKKDVTEAIKAAEPEVLDFEDDQDDFGFAEPDATIENVRTALKNYQTALNQSLLDDGESEEDARRGAIDKARGLLLEVSGLKSLAGLEQSKYADVVTAADKAREAL